MQVEVLQKVLELIENGHSKGWFSRDENGTRTCDPKLARSYCLVGAVEESCRLFSVTNNLDYYNLFYSLLKENNDNRYLHIYNDTSFKEEVVSLIKEAIKRVS